MNPKHRTTDAPPTIDGQAANVGGLDISMELDDPDLDAAIAQALAATERLAEDSARRRGAAKRAVDPAEDPERSMHIVVDDSESISDGFDFMGEGQEGSSGFDFLGSSTPAAEATPGFDDLDAELEAALEDEDEADEGDLQAEMEKLLAGSFSGGTVSDDDPDLAFPDFHEDEDEDILAEDQDSDELFAAGDDGEGAIPLAAREEREALRAQVAELSRALSLRDLELRTAEDRVDALEQQVVTATRQSAGVSREFESFRRRAERDREELQKFAGEKVIREFLGVFDNLERALNHAGVEHDGPLGQGVAMTLGQFLAALKRCGADRVEGDLGTVFDPQFHEAVGQEWSGDVPAGRIVHEMQAGFTLHTRLLRASMVTVSRGAEPSSEGSEGDDASAREQPAEAPSAEAPSTEAPSTEAPSVEAPSAEAPSTEAPSVEAPSAEAPSAEAPSVEAEPAAAATKPKRKRSSKKKATKAKRATSKTDGEGQGASPDPEAE